MNYINSKYGISFFGDIESLNISKEESILIEEALYFYEHVTSDEESSRCDLKYNMQGVGYFSDEKEDDNQTYRFTYNLLIKLLDNPYVHQENKVEIQGVLSDRKFNPPKSKIQKKIEKEKSKVKGHIYLIESLGLYKIGKTKNPTNRMKNFTTIFPAKINEIHSFITNDMNGIEKFLHNRFAHLRHTGEWFNLSQEDVDYICSIEDYGL